MPTPKRQHFNPILHLKHFEGSDPKGHVWTYDAETGDVRSAIAKETAVQSHFYSVEGDDGTMDTRVEEFLAKIESNAAPVYEAMLRGGIPKSDSQERADFSTFLALMYVRTPAMRRMGAEIIGRGIQTLAYAYGSNEKAFEGLNRRAEEAGARQLNAEEKERIRKTFLDPTGYKMQIPKERTLMVLKAADGLAPIFFNMTWSLMTAANGFFITSDNPLVREVDPGSRSAFYGDGGFVNKTAEVTFPLSPKLLLMMSWNPCPRMPALSRELVELVNKARAANSDRYLYAHVRHRRIQQLAAEFRDSRPGMTTEGFGPKKFAKIEVARRIGASSK